MIYEGDIVRVNSCIVLQVVWGDDNKALNSLMLHVLSAVQEPRYTLYSLTTNESNQAPPNNLTSSTLHANSVWLRGWDSYRFWSLPQVSW